MGMLVWLKRARFRCAKSLKLASSVTRVARTPAYTSLTKLGKRLKCHRCKFSSVLACSAAGPSSTDPGRAELGGSTAGAAWGSLVGDGGTQQGPGVPARHGRRDSPVSSVCRRGETGLECRSQGDLLVLTLCRVSLLPGTLGLSNGLLPPLSVLLCPCRKVFSSSCWKIVSVLVYQQHHCSM